jgi:hypothetical protein
MHVTIEEIVFVSPTEAAFVYSLHSSGGDLAGELGGARLTEGTWKPTRTTICQDTAEGGGTCPP